MTKAIILDTETRPVLTQERLKELVHYNPETGVFTCLQRVARRKVGDLIGTTTKEGYLRCNIDKNPYLLPRLAFLYMTGNFPIELTDHINRNGYDNRWCNLREASISENNRKRKVLSQSSTGIKGLSFLKGQYPAYKAEVTVGKTTVAKTIGLNNRDEASVKEELISWLKDTREALHKEFARHE